MSSRTRLSIPFLVGIVSSVVLGIVWGIVYVTLRIPPETPTSTAIEISQDAASLLPPPSQKPEIPPTLAPPEVPAPPPSASLSQELPVQSSSRGSAPPTSPVPPRLPSIPESKPKQHDASMPPSTSSQPTAMTPPAGVPTDEVPALQGISPDCMVELEKLCEGVEPGGARRKCFKENEEKLSPACQRAFDKMAARIAGDMQHFKAACQGDVKQFCPQVSPGGGNILQCLEENYKEVSENCYQALKRFQKMKAGRSL